MSELHVEREHWWLRWGYKVFWAMVALLVASCQVTSQSRELVVDELAQPVGVSARVEEWMYGRSFYVSQLRFVDIDLRQLELDVRKRATEAHSKDTFYERLYARHPEWIATDPRERHAERVKHERTREKERELESLMADMSRRRGESLRRTRVALLLKIQASRDQS